MAKTNKMTGKERVGIALLLVLAVVVLFAFILVNTNVAVLNPAGPIAHEQFQLIVFAALLSLVVVIPVFVMTAIVAWKYRESNKSASYRPNWDHDRRVETLWWGIPTLLILILSIVTWRTSHSLDPFRPIASSAKPITIQVIALDWKWLFIYPAQHMASVNYVEFPVNTPVNFQITSDAPMNSFWIPQLGGQIYAMSGMSTQLHLMATRIGDFSGHSANISGEGFASMTFVAHAAIREDFDHWVTAAQASSEHLSQTTYELLAKPSQNNHVTYYSDPASYLYDKVVIKTAPDANNVGSNTP